MISSQIGWRGLWAGVVLLLGLARPLRAEEGATLFAEQCAACHGQDGHAKTPAGRKVGAKDLAQSVLSDPAIEHQIAEGAKDSEGRVKMPPFKDQLSPDDINALVSYVKSFREPRK